MIAHSKFFMSDPNLKQLHGIIAEGGGIDEKQAMDKFVDFYKMCSEKAGKYMQVVGDATYFDFPWINRYLNRNKYPVLQELSGNFKAVRDTYSQMLGMAHISYEDFLPMEKYDIFKMAWKEITGNDNYPKLKTSNSHKAEEDAICICEMICTLDNALKMNKKRKFV
jgi:hypothetical protein